MTRSELVRREMWPALIEGPSRKAVMQEVGRAFRAGELAGAGNLVRRGNGRWEVSVWRIKDPAPRWRPSRPVLVAGGVVLALGAAGAAGWWLVSATVSAVSALSLPLIATAAALAWLLYRVLSSGSGSGGGCETTVTVTHRHRH